MAGLLDTNSKAAQSAPQAQKGEPKLNDPILKQVESEIEAKVPPDMKNAYLGVVVAGMRVMYDESTAKLMDDQLQKSDDIPANVAEGIAKLMVLLYNESKGKLPIPAAALASISLMAQALDYGEKKFGFQITPELVNETTKQTMFSVLGAFGIDKNAIKQQVTKGAQPQAQQAQQTPGVQ